MNTIKTGLLLGLVFAMNCVAGQKVVVMNLPPQADQPLKVVALFEEKIPEGIPVVLGLMGYHIEGGLAPYLFEWWLNGEVISTNDIAIFVPQKGDDLSLTVIDNNSCRASTSFNLKIASVPGYADDKARDEGIVVYPTLVKSDIFIEFPQTDQETALVRIFNFNGILVFQESLSESKRVNLNISPGNYFISVKTSTLHQVEKIIVQ